MCYVVIDGNCLMIDGGWLNLGCMYRGVLFGFFKRKYFPVFKLKDTLKKSVSMRFVAIVIDTLSSLYFYVILFIQFPSWL